MTEQEKIQETEYLLQRALDDVSLDDFFVDAQNDVFRIIDCCDDEIFLTGKEARSATLKLVKKDGFEAAWGVLNECFNSRKQEELEDKWCCE